MYISWSYDRNIARGELSPDYDAQGIFLRLRHEGVLTVTFLARVGYISPCLFVKGKESLAGLPLRFLKKQPQCDTLRIAVYGEHVIVVVAAATVVVQYPSGT